MDIKSIQTYLVSAIKDGKIRYYTELFQLSGTFYSIGGG